jgi:hypothetical protein
MEYDDQAWVATANNIVAELAWTNSLLEKSIEVAEGSRAASEWMCSGLELFLQQQREFQALLFKELRLDPRWLWIRLGWIQMRKRRRMRRWKMRPEVRRADPKGMRGLWKCRYFWIRF